MAKLVGIGFIFDGESEFSKEVDALKILLDNRDSVVVRENALIVVDKLTQRVTDLFERLKWTSDLHCDCSALLDEITSLVNIINGLRLISEGRITDIETVVRVVLDTTRYIIKVKESNSNSNCKLELRGENL